MWIIRSEAVGFVAFLPAVVGSTLAFLTTPRKQRRARYAWAAIAAFYTLLVAEAQAKMRYVIGADLRRLATQVGVYSERRGPQAFLLLILIAAAAAIVIRLARDAPTRAGGTARAATVAVFAIFVGESVSLHTVDGILYSLEGPMRVVCWLWLACGWTTTAAAIQCAYGQRRHW